MREPLHCNPSTGQVFRSELEQVKLRNRDMYAMLVRINNALLDGEETWAIRQAYQSDLIQLLEDCRP